MLIYAGIPGRKHLYSYVNEKGKWWKTVDNIIEEVRILNLTPSPATTDFKKGVGGYCPHRPNRFAPIGRPVSTFVQPRYRTYRNRDVRAYAMASEFSGKSAWPFSKDSMI